MAKVQLPFVPEGMSVVPDEELDLRPDDEIITQLRNYVPTGVDRRNVWTYWDKGYDCMPGWQRRNVINWVRLLNTTNTGPPWVIRVLDKVPGSANHFSRYLEPSLLPAVLLEDRMTGPFVGQHSADLVRLAALIQHGGVWLDVGTILLRHLDDIWSLIEDPATPTELFATSFNVSPERTILINTYLAAKAGNEFLRRWHAVYLELWKGGATECTGFHAHPLVRHIPLYQPPGEEMDTGMTAEGITDYGAHMLCAQRVRDLVDVEDGFDGRSYVETKVCLVPSNEEVYSFSIAHAFNGLKEFAVLATRYDAPDDPGFAHAREQVDRLLRGALFFKLSNGLSTKVPWLSAMWNRVENAGADNAPGTFAEYVRQGALQFRQTRELKCPKVEPTSDRVWTAGLLKPLDHWER